mmetsp:Transcript_16029/g.34792  ORF Transcript_16029/g.34792 Transcript_16029/m.34792 type:complete len:119 (-) Transcript_16029:1975-2331(-)
MVSSSFASEADYVLQTVFGLPTDQNGEGKHFIPRDNLKKRRVFDRNKFPYQLPSGTKHWTMWYTYGPPEISDEQITSDIQADLRVRVGDDDFDFVWYENPKMTIPEVYHVQVFWRTRD